MENCTDYEDLEDAYYYEPVRRDKSRKNLLLLFFASPSILNTLAIIGGISLVLGLCVGGFWWCLKLDAPLGLLVLCVCWYSAYRFAKITNTMSEVLEARVNNLKESVINPSPTIENSENGLVCTQTEANRQTSKQVFEYFNILKHGRIEAPKKPEQLPEPEPSNEDFEPSAISVTLHGENGNYTFSYLGQRNPKATYTLSYLKTKLLPSVTSRYNSAISEQAKEKHQKYITFIEKVITEAERLERAENLRIAEMQSGGNGYEDYVKNTGYRSVYLPDKCMDGNARDIVAFNRAISESIDKGLPMPEAKEFNVTIYNP